MSTWYLTAPESEERGGELSGGLRLISGETVTVPLAECF